LARAFQRASPAKSQSRLILNQIPCTNRKALLLGTALASTLVLISVLTPTPAAAVACIQPASPNPINDTEATFITCVNTEPRTNAAGNAIYLQTTGTGSYIDLYNSGTLSAANAASGAVGILAYTQSANSAVTIENHGDIAATNAPSAGAGAIFAYTQGANGAVTVENHGDIVAAGSVAFGIRTVALNSPIAVLSDGAIQVTSSNNALGIDAVGGGNSPIAIENHGNIAADAGNNAYGIHAGTYGASSPIDIVNSGDVAASSIGNSAFGISARLLGSYSPLSIENSGDFSVTGVYGFGIRVNSYGGYNPVSIENSGDFVATSTGRSAFGIAVLAYSRVDIENSGAFAVNSAYSGFGIRALTLNGTSPISIENSGAFAVNAAGGDATGIFAYSRGAPSSSISIQNTGALAVEDTGFGTAIGIRGFAIGSAVKIVNSGDIAAVGRNVMGINAQSTLTYVPGSRIDIVNSGDVTATAFTFYATGISASGRGPIDIYNSGDVLATTSGRDAWGIIALTGVLAGSSIHIVNTGDLRVSGVAPGLGNIPTAGIAAQSFLAADSPIAIENEGALTVSALANAFGIVAYTSGANSPISIENRGDICDWRGILRHDGRGHQGCDLRR
jgi:hypothetical protein